MCKQFFRLIIETRAQSPDVGENKDSTRAWAGSTLSSERRAPTWTLIFDKIIVMASGRDPSERKKRRKKHRHTPTGSKWAARGSSGRLSDVPAFTYIPGAMHAIKVKLIDKRRAYILCLPAREPRHDSPFQFCTKD